MNIVCSSCLITNRIPDSKSHVEAKCGKCHNSVYSADPLNLTDDTFYAFVERNTLPVVVDFWASWCGPCKTMAPIFTAVASQSPDILFAKVNTETAEQVSRDANIRSIPTLIFFHKGKEIDRVSGALNEMQLKQWLVQNIQKINA